MAAIDNPRHPHYCTVYRAEDTDSFTDLNEAGGGRNVSVGLGVLSNVGLPIVQKGLRTVLYKGKCRKYVTKGLRGSSVSANSQYTLSVPATVRAKTGDVVEVDDRIGHFVGIVTDCNAGNLGTDIYWNHDNR